MGNVSSGVFRVAKQTNWVVLCSGPGEDYSLGSFQYLLFGSYPGVCTAND